MELIYLLIILIAVGVILYIANHYIPMDATIKNILNAVVLIVVVVWLVLWLLGAIGMHTPFPRYP